ncbi:MAG TPA: ABC transporter permease [Bryobacteraceae bacterium]|nr:ABC transporter permease [Bryobacteraceae bacterium]
MLAQVKSWWRALTGQSRLAGEMASEMDGHMERYAADLMARGVEPGEARRRARIEFGSTAAAAEECREAVGLRWPNEFGRDLRYAVRVLRKSPTFTAAAVATLALCIGANTAIFSVVDAVLLRPLPYPAPERLFSVARHFQGKGSESYQTNLWGSAWEAVRDNATYLDAAVFSDGSMGVNFAAGGGVDYVKQQRVSAGFFRVLGIKPLIGREFSMNEDRPAGPAVTVLSYALWKRVFHADPSIVGQAVTLRGEPHIIVGVLPAGFRSIVPADLWTPLRPSRSGEGGGSNYAVVARLHSGASWAQANGQIEAIGAPLMRQYGQDASTRLRLISFQRGLTVDVRQPILILWAAVGVVLLIGCVNIAGLLLARAAGRTREMATRMALGSGRAALIRQMLAESVVLGLCGGAAGTGLGWLGVKALKALTPASLNLWQAVDLDWRVLAATAFASIAAGILFGLYPALAASRLQIRAALGEAGRAVAGGRNPWPRRLLVTSEVALGVVLLVGAGLLIRTFAHLRGLNPGFDAHNVITAELSLQDARYATSQSVNRLFEQSLARMRELPGVESAAVTISLPYERALNTGFQRMDGPHVDTESQITNMFYITPEYFRVLRIPLLRGRVFTAADSSISAPATVVSEAFVKMYMPGDEPVGRHLDLGGGEKREIVGVVGDVQQKSGWGDGAPTAAMPDIYIPAMQVQDKFMQLVHTWFSPSWTVRSAGPAEGVIAGMQRALESVDPQLPFAGFHSMEDVRYRALSQERFQVVLLGALAGLALLLAAVGIYGLIANSVAERTRELGIRLALGATVPQAIRSVALPGVALALAGVIVGSVLAAFATQMLRHLVWGVRPGDPLTFAAVGVGLLGVAAAASFLPALRVTRLNPAETLRQE